MKLSKPEDMETEELDDEQSPSSEEELMVNIGGSENPVTEVVAGHAEMLSEPSMYGMAEQSEVEELRDRVEELEEKNEEMREWLELAFRRLDQGDDLGKFHLVSEGEL